MMDSQEKALEQEQNVEQNVVETATPAPEAEVTETPEAEVAAPEEAPVAEPERKQYQNKKEVLARAREIAQGEEAPQKEEVDYLKTAFYKLHIAEREARLKEYIDGGGDPEAYQILPDEDEEAFKAEMGIIKERRQKLFKEQEQEKQENLQRKLEIIEKIKAMVTSPEEANKSYKEFKALQEEWKEIKNVPAEKANELWRNYTTCSNSIARLVNTTSRKTSNSRRNSARQPKSWQRKLRLSVLSTNCRSYIRSSAK